MVRLIFKCEVIDWEGNSQFIEMEAKNAEDAKKKTLKYIHEIPTKNIKFKMGIFKIIVNDLE